jgi:hypothetical protein
VGVRRYFAIKSYNARHYRKEYDVLTLRSTSKEEDLFEPHFYCPKCYVQRPYEVKLASIDFTFYFIPLFETKNLDKFVVCRVCQKGFDPDILIPSNQSLFKLVGATRHELLHYSSPGSLKLKLMSDGLKEEFVNKLITLAHS